MVLSGYISSVKHQPLCIQTFIHTFSVFHHACRLYPESLKFFHVMAYGKVLLFYGKLSTEASKEFTIAVLSKICGLIL